MQGQIRSVKDRRSGKDRRKLSFFKRLFGGGAPPRSSRDRRQQEERRSGWVRLTKWSSVHLEKLKISKFLGRR